MHADTLLSHPEYKDKLVKYAKKEGKTYIVKDGDIVHFNCKIKWFILFIFLLPYHMLK